VIGQHHSERQPHMSATAYDDNISNLTHKNSSKEADYGLTMKTLPRSRAFFIALNALIVNSGIECLEATIPTFFDVHRT
jgi:hypothetical protein